MKCIIVMHVRGDFQGEFLVCQHEFRDVRGRRLDFPLELLPLELLLLLAIVVGRHRIAVFDRVGFAVLDFGKVVPDGDEAPGPSQCLSREGQSLFLLFDCGVGIESVRNFSIALTLFIVVAVAGGVPGFVGFFVLFAEESFLLLFFAKELLFFIFGRRAVVQSR